MLGKSPDQSQMNLFQPVLKQIINPAHELVVLADAFPWDELEKEFSALYADTGAPSKPVRLMTGLLVLKQMFNYSDERLITEWLQNPYFQYLSGEAEFRWHKPCDPSDIAHFRKRIGEKGIEKIVLVLKELQENKSLLRRIFQWFKSGKRG